MEKLSSKDMKGLLEFWKEKTKKLDKIFSFYINTQHRRKYKA